MAGNSNGGLWKEITRKEVAADDDIREGRFQRSLALLAGFSSLLSGLDVTLEHYRGSYGQKIMYAPVVISPILLVAGVWGFFSKKAAKTVLPVSSWMTLAVCATGFGFHIRGIARKPGGWRLPVANIVMGPPLFAPLLFGISGYLGVMAAHLRRADAPKDDTLHPLAHPARAVAELVAGRVSAPADDDEKDATPTSQSWEQDVREGRFQKHLAAMTAVASLFSGFEALYSHYKSNFRYKAQWSPVILAPLLTAAGIAGVFNKKAARTALPALSLLAILDGTVGFYYHFRGVMRKPGGLKKPLYNFTYGPPIFAPLLFAACGFLGVLASLMRREELG